VRVQLQLTVICIDFASIFVVVFVRVNVAVTLADDVRAAIVKFRDFRSKVKNLEEIVNFK